jgi:hypothetical protein
VTPSMCPRGNWFMPLARFYLRCLLMQRHLEVKGGPVPLVTGLSRATGQAGNTAAANYGFTKAGALVYLIGLAPPLSAQGVLAIVDRDGTVRRLQCRRGQPKN